MQYEGVKKENLREVRQAPLQTVGPFLFPALSSYGQEVRGVVYTQCAVAQSARETVHIPRGQLDLFVQSLLAENDWDILAPLLPVLRARGLDSERMARDALSKSCADTLPWARTERYLSYFRAAGIPDTEVYAILHAHNQLGFAFSQSPRWFLEASIDLQQLYRDLRDGSSLPVVLEHPFLFEQAGITPQMLYDDLLKQGFRGDIARHAPYFIHSGVQIDTQQTVWELFDAGAYTTIFANADVLGPFPKRVLEQIYTSCTLVTRVQYWHVFKNAGVTDCTERELYQGIVMLHRFHIITQCIEELLSMGIAADTIYSDLLAVQYYRDILQQHARFEQAGVQIDYGEIYRRCVQLQERAPQHDSLWQRIIIEYHDIFSAYVPSDVMLAHQDALSPVGVLDSYPLYRDIRHTDTYRHALDRAPTYLARDLVAAQRLDAMVDLEEAGRVLVPEEWRSTLTQHMSTRAATEDRGQEPLRENVQLDTIMARYYLLQSLLGEVYRVRAQPGYRTAHSDTDPELIFQRVERTMRACSEKLITVLQEFLLYVVSKELQSQPVIEHAPRLVLYAPYILKHFSRAEKQQYFLQAAVLFANLKWGHMFGGVSWVRIAQAGYTLYSPDKQTRELAIDHVFDLVHNTGDLFTKQHPYIQTDKEIRSAILDIKRYTTNTKELLKKLRQHTFIPAALITEIVALQQELRRVT